MSYESIHILREELAKGHSGLARRYLDDRIEMLSESEEPDDALKPFSETSAIHMDCAKWQIWTRIGA